MNAECTEKGHDWAKTGLWHDGHMEIPCKRDVCETALMRTHQGDEYVEEGIFSLLGMDIEDDPEGGVAKIVCREILTSYRLDKIQLRPDDVVVDIGAHVGCVSIWLAKRFPHCYVYAFEPSPVNYARLVRNIESNGVHNVTPMRVAVTGSGRVVMLYGDIHGNSGGLSIYGEGTGETAMSTTLQQIISGFGMGGVALLKMDCEGAEYEIINAIPDTPGNLLSHVGFFVAEFHYNDRFTSRGDTPQALASKVWKHIPRFNTVITTSG